MKTVDLILKNGVIHTMAAEESVRAVAVSGGEIVYVGDDAGAEALASEGTKVIDLAGRCVTPGFIDGHTHEVMYMIDDDTTLVFDQLEPVFEVYRDAFAAFVKEHPGAEMYFGNGMDLNAFPGGEPTKDWLNEICPDVPVAIKDMSVHSMVMNDKAMELVGLDRDTVPPPGGVIYKDGNGEPTGYVVDCMSYDDLFPQRDRSKTKYREAFLRFQKRCNSYGITGIDIAGPTIPAEEAWEVFDEMQKAGELTVRVNCTLLDFRNPHVNAERGKDYVKLLEEGQKYNSDWQKVSQAKCIIDGVPEGRSAFLLEPYEPSEGQEPDFRGVSYIEQQDLIDFVTEINKAGYQVQLHAMGDAGVNYALNAYEASAKANGDKDYRNMIAHVTLITADDMKRMGKLKVIGTMQPLWFYYNPVFGPLEEMTLGKARTQTEYKIRDFLDAGIRITGSIDFPIQDDFRPLYGMETLVTQSSPYEGEKDDPKFVRNADQVITQQEMLEVYTVNGAYEMMMEDKIGTIEVGKKADLVVLGQDILHCDPKTIAQTEIFYTIVDGKVVYEK